ncbi:biotin transporter BioY [Aestuariimicrobium sp. T2.26MG-19.2B]|uniref:biotin transporter BioY n=1 Tax=Aestuariimicrobium sp. T2.26MG-19.2B TaxID=3040679 RepID=UPI002477966D|nr:biotin transporter BioY [Aestuariimicrobium sp. T2.26MG-19.2B]CAI9407001.1 Biotin transporter BioY [Aestuariimicrobium sp. T2.26MG-19.2B]
MRAKDLALIALFTALMCVLGLAPRIQLPLLPAPFTTQTLGVMLAGGILGWKRGTLSMLLFVLLVAIGAPVLVGGLGGFGMLLGPTGGFIWAYPLGALVTGLLVERWWIRLNAVSAFIACFVGGALAVYVIGQPWLIVASAKLTLAQGWWSWVVYLPGDILKAVVAALVIITVKRAYPLITPRVGRPITDDPAAGHPTGDQPGLKTLGGDPRL